MNEQNQKITEYLKKAILAQIDKSIDFKKGEFYKISQDQFKSGVIDPNITLELFKKNKTNKEKEDKDTDKIDESLYILLVAKTIKTELEGSQKKDEEIEDLTGIFYIPALLNKKTSSLLPCFDDNKLPWFPREFLSPMIEPELAIGSLEKYQDVISDEIYNIYQIKNWDDYIKYCERIYKATTSCELDNNEIYNINRDNEAIKLEENVYILLDNAINSTYFIKRLYADIVEQKNLQLPLYENFISLEKKEDRELEKNTPLNRMKHFGQMGGKFGLSSSQREAINHFQNINDGEILAIQGPPGTGKTTLLQSIISTKYIENALKQELPPIIVATSTNNQAVTNIIDSFGKISSTFGNNLGTRWIEGVNSFATYFPSRSREKEAKERNVQYTNKKGEFFVKKIDNEENIKLSTEKFLKEAKNLFKVNADIETYMQILFEKLTGLNELKNKFISVTQSLKDMVKDTTVNEFLRARTQELEQLKAKQQDIVKRIEFWENKYKNDVPLIWKVLSSFRKYKIKISNKLKIFANENENFDDDIIGIDYIGEYYAKEKGKINKIISNVSESLKLAEEYKKQYEQIAVSFKKFYVNTDEIQNKFLIEVNEVDEWLDKNVRYILFWLAVHYYEARWIKGDCALTDKQQGKTFKNVLETFYKRLCMVTPCLVMTFYKLPGQFEAYVGEDSWEFLYNTIDLLIVDEAGQVSTEIGACSFALAKKAIVVGDEKQIEPVWAIDRPLDKSLAIQEKVINNENEFDILETSGLTTSSSSVMRVACKSSNYSKYNQKGLFLSEHRRCFNEIIEYCNELVYNGNLEPLRGNGGDNRILPKMGHYFIDTKKSQKVGTSRKNTEEAIEIAKWILENAEKIFDYYKKKEDNKASNRVDLSKIIGIITPFKEQAREIRRALKTILPQYLYDLITVGTVHTFQGGERKVIIFSTTYGSNDGCFFLDAKENLMNVAVSRAEDSFLVFGNVNCLKDEEKSPSGLLRKYIIDNSIE